MKEEILIAGFGGQGVLSMGKILAYGAVMQGQEVSWIPSYGPEMRGGTANVTVIVSDQPISSPVLHEFDVVIALNQQSIDRFMPSVKSGGILFYDPNGVTHAPQRNDIDIYKIPATAKAVQTGNVKVFNMIVLGAYLKIRPIVNIENITAGLRKSLPERAHSMIGANIEAVQIGGQIVEKCN
ncbi:MAG: 2-oxoacid:acceptor oxidoreductase family protein [Mucinivorans sp.]